MTRLIPLSALGLFLAAAPALAAAVLPACVASFKGPLSLRFRYDVKERYHRVVRAALSPLPCSLSGKEPAFGLKLSEPALSAFGVALSPELRERVAQAQHGGSVYRPASLTPALLASKLPSYTVEVNRRLARDYGFGFAGEVYRSWVASRPGSARVKERLIAEMRRQLAQSPEASVDELRARSAGTVFAISLGLGWETEITLDTPSYVRDFIESIRSIGVETVLLRRPALGTMAGNSAAIEPQLKTLLDSGKDVVLLGLSKGAPELLDAASRVVAPTLDGAGRQTRVPKGHGRIRASLMLSPLYGGLIASDLLEKHPHPTSLLEIFLRDLEALGSSREKQAGDFVKLLHDVTSPAVAAFTGRFWRKLPRDIVYLNGSGVIAGDGLPGRVRDNAIGPIVDGNRKLRLDVGANDGLIEFPGNLMPSGIAPPSECFLFTASHLLFDGKYEEFPLSDPRVDRALYAAIANLALD